MSVQELICELMATCSSLEDQVIVGDAGRVTKVSMPAPGHVYLNAYDDEDASSKDP